jgi:hypothetical protein
MTPAAKMSDTPVQVHRTDNGWQVTVEGYTEAGAVGGYLWPGGVPAGVSIELLVAVVEPSQFGTFEIRGLTLEALQAMDPAFATLFADASVMTADPPSPQDSTPQQPPPASSGPGVPVQMDENELKEWVHGILEGGHYVGDTAELVGIFASEGTKLAALAEVLGPVGEVTGTIVVLWAVVHAFGTGTRLEEQLGFCYGLMWETFGMPDGVKRFTAWAPNTADELRNAFYDGVGEGRDKAKDVKVHNAIMAKVAYNMAVDHTSQNTAQWNLVNELWNQVREEDLGDTIIAWPKPDDMQGTS